MYNYKMIQGNGVDIVDLRRFRIMDQRRLDRLAKRILTVQELEGFTATIDSKKHIFLAKHWAVKEAVAKSFGTGIRGTVVWKNIQMRKTHLGQPKIYFQPILHAPGRQCHVSISHDGDYLIAYAILEHAY
jgi:holo-[acyl-carrier protein] synthase